eukprot:9470248-Pyramimonas_sp.AAC.1
MQACLEAMRGARGGPLPCVEPRRIYAVASVADPKKARGVDNMGPLGMQRLPPDGVIQLAQLYNSVEHAGLWPQQFCAAVGAMALKPAGWGARAWHAPYHPEDLDHDPGHNRRPVVE